MSDFASAAMLRVLHAGMRRMGLQSPAQQWLAQATVPLDAKQQLVMQVLRERGLSALLHLGQGVHDLRHDSLMPLLIHPGQPLRMLQAWLRLERYLHSKHRIRQILLFANEVQHVHHSLQAGNEPSAAEDLVVLGVLIALLQSTGCQQIEVELGSGIMLWPWQDDLQQKQKLAHAFAQVQTHVWRMRWLDVMAQRSEPSAPMQTGDSLSRQIQSMALQSAEPISLEDAAHALGHSTRSLQRKLQQEGTRFVDLIAGTRAERAAHLLAHAEPGLAEIGFASGYTDQAHFCRDFKRRVGMSPLRYREHALSS